MLVYMFEYQTTFRVGVDTTELPRGHRLCGRFEFKDVLARARGHDGRLIHWGGGHPTHQAKTWLSKKKKPILIFPPRARGE